MTRKNVNLLLFFILLKEKIIIQFQPIIESRVSFVVLTFLKVFKSCYFLNDCGSQIVPYSFLCYKNKMWATCFSYEVGDEDGERQTRKKKIKYFSLKVG